MRLSIISLFFLLRSTYSEKQFRHDYTYHPEVTGWTKLHLIPASWQEARLRCHLEGATLISPTAEFMLILKENIYDHLIEKMHTGLHATFSKGDFTTLEGVTICRANITENWASREPDNYGNDENCIALNSNGLLMDIDCSSVGSYMCYKKELGEEINKCGTVDKEYKMEETTNRCYKVHNIPRKFSRAFMTCQAEGGYLTIINSEEEAQHIKNLLADHPEDKIRGCHKKDRYYVGITDQWDQDGEWMTIHGQPIWEAGYSKFANEPNNTEYTEGIDNEWTCGAVTRAAEYKAVNCVEKFGFICEKDPTSLQ